MNIYFARQPVFTREKEIYGYELLFRDGMENLFPGIDGSSATSRVLTSAFFSSDIEKITGGKRAFVNFTRKLIDLEIPRLFPAELTIVEILEDIHPDGPFLEGCRSMSLSGYRIAMDDFEYRSELEGLVRLADIIKIDFLNTGTETIRSLVRDFSGSGKTLLAEKVETARQFDLACELGFGLFQGYFFSRPEVMRKQEIPPLKMNLLEIMSEAGRGDFRIEELERLITRDVGISYKLLRYLNSPFFRRRREITSIRHAILMLGEQGIRSFLAVIIMSDISLDKPDELLKSSVIRAKICEGLGTLAQKGPEPSMLFTLGLFSLIDAILDSPMEQVLDKLPLDREIKAALLNRDSLMGTYLRLAESYERGDWNGVAGLGTSLGIETGELPVIYFDALGWADALMNSVRAA
jgi:EAL and modified HD-GYP domain-containing signal transduction protein